MCIVGKMAQDVGMVSVVVSFQSSWLLRVPSLHTLVFIQLVSVAFFWYCCLGMVREKRGGRGG